MLMLNGFCLGKLCHAFIIFYGCMLNLVLVGTSFWSQDWFRELDSFHLNAVVFSTARNKSNIKTIVAILWFLKY